MTPKMKFFIQNVYKNDENGIFRTFSPKFSKIDAKKSRNLSVKLIFKTLFQIDGS